MLTASPLGTWLRSFFTYCVPTAASCCQKAAPGAAGPDGHKVSTWDNGQFLGTKPSMSAVLVLSREKSSTIRICPGRKEQAADSMSLPSRVSTRMATRVSARNQ